MYTTETVCVSIIIVREASQLDDYFDYVIVRKLRSDQSPSPITSLHYHWPRTKHNVTTAQEQLE